MVLATLLWTESPGAQTVKAGIVTTLEGQVTARRAAPPGGVHLKFKDDIFLQDTVATGDKSLARMLLGGKAVVTVRERSPRPTGPASTCRKTGRATAWP
ncbi:MAG: hypothetical protein FJZ38_04875 [Candidatus Rokubacteria bacterium]|nr:hypothetical protein [Candidatus Rokubacteria bacterium]